MGKTDKSGVTSQTLERGLAVLEWVADNAPCTAGDVASSLGLHRSIAYRLLTTLEARGYLQRDDSGRYELGLTPLVIGAASNRGLTALAERALRQITRAVPASAYLAVRRDTDALVLMSAASDRPATVSLRDGMRHPLDQGAAGLAILAALPPTPDERPEVGLARETGYTRTVGEVLPGVGMLAVPVEFEQGGVGSLCVVFVPGTVDRGSALTALIAAADQLGQLGIKGDR
ncbi:IclR family transcriptional regulator [Rhodococcus sp. AG1013]|uniref:IclR family transcriptional regulator n=1 Tax=unclassified Rhodococcus (in: high G+C Gram-positive bacteria) TaxID=192944 RepID=UPI000E0C0BFD|nr:helix-turn-helix domain-containing protein [Rhodococcus sp. AG1013]RDI18964.1 IclR family transcriptional regulator [Rhodococcus sp. AG1013]